MSWWLRRKKCRELFGGNKTKGGKSFFSSKKRRENKLQDEKRMKEEKNCYENASTVYGCAKVFICGIWICCHAVGSASGLRYKKMKRDDWDVQAFKRAGDKRIFFSLSLQRSLNNVRHERMWDISLSRVQLTFICCENSFESAINF